MRFHNGKLLVVLIILDPDDDTPSPEGTVRMLLTTPLVHN